MEKLTVDGTHLKICSASRYAYVCDNNESREKIPKELVPVKNAR